MKEKHNRDEVELLRQLRRSGPLTIISLRDKLSWDVPKFAKNIIGLEKAQLLIRDGMRISISSAGIRFLSRFFSEEHSDKMQASSFLDSVRVPRLQVSSLYLPDYNRFLQATQRKAYTSKANRARPERRRVADQK